MNILYYPRKVFNFLGFDRFECGTVLPITPFSPPLAFNGSSHVMTSHQPHVATIGQCQGSGLLRLWRGKYF